MKWTAIIPLNAPPLRKSRLAGALSAPLRVALSEQLYQHGFRCAERSGLFERIFTLSPSQRDATWLPQEHRELNSELSRVRTLLSCPLLVLNADLPLLDEEDLHALVDAAERSGCALAPDRHAIGTNAIATLPDAPLTFSFGPGSLAAHLCSAPDAHVVWRSGLACDLDTPADIAHVLGSGRLLPEAVERLMRAARPTSAPSWAHVD